MSHEKESDNLKCIICKGIREAGDIDFWGTCCGYWFDEEDSEGEYIIDSEADDEK